MENHKTEIKCNVCSRFSPIAASNGLRFYSHRKKEIELTLMGWMLSFLPVMMLDFLAFLWNVKSFFLSGEKMPGSIAEWIGEKIRKRLKKKKEFCGAFFTLFMSN